MRSSSPVFTKEEQKRLLKAHEYTSEAPSLRYQDCICYRHRTEFTCIKCGYCYSCHWKKEQIEGIEFRDNFKDFYLSLPSGSNEDEKRKPKVQTKEEDGVNNQVPEKWKSLDVLGQPSEPICAYYRCHHKFSLHGSKSCRCKHPTNKTLGLQVRYL